MGVIASAPWEPVLPIRSGIPFPRGVLGSSDNLRLLAPDGSEMCVQAKTLARWPDNSVKAVLLNTMALEKQPLLLDEDNERLLFRAV